MGQDYDATAAATEARVARRRLGAGGRACRGGGYAAGLGAAHHAGLAHRSRPLWDRSGGYYTDAKPLIGRANLEYSYGGATWRFRNSGNRAAFTDNPDVYMPRFGGHDPMAVVRGVNMPGHPDFWLISAGGLYLLSLIHI